MGHRFSIAVTAAVVALAATPAFAQSQLPRPSQLPPAGGQAQQPQQQQRPQQPTPLQQLQQPQQQAAPQMAPPRPYKVVAVGVPKPFSDPSFEAFRKRLGEVAQKKDRKALAGLMAKTFFWLGEKGDIADKKRPAIDNLAKAVGLDAQGGTGWEVLGGYAADPTAAPFPERKDTICAPAGPEFNPQDLEALAKTTGTEEGDWGFTVEAGIEMRAGAQPNSAVVEKLGMHLVRVMPDAAPPNPQAPMLRIVAPSGKVGFVPADAISPLAGDELCYVKEGGAWKIAGMIGGEQ
ncbi:MAG: hypothetical protein FJX62_18575 [Alphaproteobacteria bacterium]|nr:hypothetical protein [Alphaproteobacteria bacterium]